MLGEIPCMIVWDLNRTPLGPVSAAAAVRIERHSFVKVSKFLLYFLDY